MSTGLAYIRLVACFTYQPVYAAFVVVLLRVLGLVSCCTVFVLLMANF